MIELRHIKKTYKTGETLVHALDDVSLTIGEGEFVAIMGPSGSGKSTFLHLLGLLDIPDSGLYEFFGKELTKVDEEGLALLRRNVFGFVFQQFNLLPRMSALENVLLPLIYSKDHLDIDHAKELLARMGLSSRIYHKPNQLSIGQQQRVAISRALINDPKIILADEPTGNLDSKTAEETIYILKELNKTGITVVLVTHEEDIARQARRIVKIRDGKVISDETLSTKKELFPSSKKTIGEVGETRRRFPGLPELWEFFKQGFKSLATNKVRTSLSMLGILIGVAAVVAMLALGRGAQRDIQNQLAALGSNLLMLRSGAAHSGGAMLETGAMTRLTLTDVENLKSRIPSIANASATVTDRGQVTYLDKNWNTQIMGVEPGYETMRSSTPLIGCFFTEAENRSRALVAIVGVTIVNEIFDDENPVGQMIKINKVNFRVIGVLPEKGAGGGWRDRDDVIVVPILTAMHRLSGRDYVDYIDIEVRDASLLDEAENDVMSLMLSTHKVPPSQQDDAFQVWNMADIKDVLSASGKTMSLLLSAIAAISLLVGGIGIMNIMLVSVTERTREIGLRKAIGAKRFDILSQFLAEAIVISATGGLLGVVIGWVIITLVSVITGWNTSISPASVILALLFSGAIGMIFGLYPARKASFLNPIDALRYE